VPQPDESTRDWPIQTCVLLQALRVALGTAPPELVWPPELAVDEFLAGVERHRVGAFLHQQVPAAARAQWPVRAQEKLAAAARHSAHRALLQSVELVRVARQFAAAKTPFLSVKGPLLARALYGDAGARHAGDLDLLVASEQLADADTVLRTAGCRRTSPDFDLTARQWREFQQMKNDFEFIHEGSGLRIEVGWRLAGLSGLKFAEARTAGTRTVLGGEEIFRLPPETEFLYLFTHGAGHGWFRLFWLVDVALLLTRTTVDWPRLMAAAREHGAEAAVWQGGRLAEQLFGVALPESLRVPASQEARVRWLTEEARRLMLASVTERAAVGELFRQLRYHACLAAGWASKTAVLRPRLMSPTNWKMLPLPDRWFALYHFAAPLLWLRRRLVQNQRRG
jgi:hypothetical protein